MSRLDQYSITMNIDGQNLGIWDKLSGGAVDSEDVKYRPGGMGDQQSLGGPTTVDNVTLTRLYDLNRDHALKGFLVGRVGKGRVTVSQQPLDTDGNAFGAPVVFTGTLKRIQFPEPDSESTDPGMIEVEVSTSGSIG